MSEKNDELLENKEENVKFELSRILRFILAISFILLNITFSADVGVIASSKFKLQKELNFNEKEFATFNSITSIGRIFGTFIYMGLLIADKRKLLTIVCLLSSCSLFFSFLFTSHKYILYIIRFLLGLSRNFFQIYSPVYIDQFGVKSLKTIMISISNITSPLGRVVGFTIGTVLGEDKWRYSFSILGTILLLFSIIIFFSPSKYFSAGASFVGYYIKNENDKNAKFVTKNDEKNKRYSDSIFEIGEIKMKKKGEFDIKSFMVILKNPTFMFSTFTKASISFIFDITHLFIKDYVHNGLGERNEILLLSYYSLASILGPSIGGTIGGLIITKVGGYEHKDSCKMISIFSVCTLISTFFLCYSDKLLTFSISLFSFYATGYTFYPIVTGYLVNSLNARQKGTGYSFTILISTLFSNFPGPLYYGFINEKFKKTNPRLAWRCSVFYYIVGFVLVQFVCYYRYKDLEKKEEEKKKDEEEMKEIDA